MSNLLKKIVAYFFSEYNYKFQTGLFKKLLYLFLVIKCAYWLCYYGLFFGEQAIADPEPASIGIIKDKAFLLYVSSPYLGYFFIFSILACIPLSYFLKKIPFVFEFIIWLLVINIQNKIYLTLTGGDLLLNQFLFFNCFLSKKYVTNSGWQNSLSVCLHNFGVIAIILQVCLVYLIAGLAKLNSNDWFNGYAVINLNKVQHFNLFSGPLFKNDILNSIANYITLFYQLLFPSLVWIHKLKKPLVILGLIMHLYIAFVTGLVGFGVIMMVAYAFFWPFKK